MPQQNVPDPSRDVQEPKRTPGSAEAGVQGDDRPDDEPGRTPGSAEGERDTASDPHAAEKATGG